MFTWSSYETISAKLSTLATIFELQLQESSRMAGGVE